MVVSFQASGAAGESKNSPFSSPSLHLFPFSCAAGVLTGARLSPQLEDEDLNLEPVELLERPGLLKKRSWDCFTSFHTLFRKETSLS